jgi:lauroyl/myristoyl acyltransferase
MNKKHHAPLIQFRDAGLIAGLLLLTPIAWLLPYKLWRPFCRILSILVSPVRRFAGGDLPQKIKAAAKASDALPAAEEIEHHVFANRVEQELQYLREYRPGGWHPVIRIKGREYIEQAAQNGKGCILWIAPLFFSSLVTKKGLYDSEIPTTFLSRFFHGPANSEFGRRYINVIKIHCEERYLNERLAMQAGKEISAARTLRKRLTEGKTIAIAWATYGSRIVSAPVVGGSFPVASGAPGLALATGAALLPVYTHCIDSNTFDVVIGPPLIPTEQASRQAAIEELVGQYSSLLESEVITDPAALTIWRHYVPCHGAGDNLST